MLKNIVEACCSDACESCAWPGCLKSDLEEHQRSQHGECMLQVMYLCLEINLRAQTFPFIPTLLNETCYFRKINSVLKSEYVCLVDSIHPNFLQIPLPPHVLTLCGHQTPWHAYTV